MLSHTIIKKASTLAELLKKALAELLKNDPLRMAGATAFFTTFALPPILVILIQTLKVVLDARTIRQELFKSLSSVIGTESVDLVQGVLLSLRKMAQNWYVIIGGFIFLLFVATTLFKIIKSSINQLWRVRPNATQGIAKGLRTRGQSLLVILLAGILFVIGLVTEGLRTVIGNYLVEFSPLISVYFNALLNQVVSIIIVMIWFVMVFRYLPDGRPNWNVAFTGGLVTALLFTLGKIILHWLLTYSNINTLYGTSASMVLLLLFVFYSSLILYFGAAFTKVLGLHKGQPIQPLPHATHYRYTQSAVESEDEKS